MESGNGLRKISGALFGVIIICFFLPFIEVSCSGNTVASITGMQLVTGSTIHDNNFLGGASSREKIPPQAWAIAAFFFTAAGFVFSIKNFIGSIRSALPPALFSGAAVLSLLMLKSKIDGNISGESFNIITVHYAIGFWLAIILLGLSVFLNLYRLKDTEEKK